MIWKFQYQSGIDRESMIANHSDKILIEDAVITEGNFLTFSDIKLLDQQLNDLNNTSNMILLKQEGII